MMGVKAFSPRMQLAEKALVDYREGRYHACVPIVLALLDGLVNELHEKRRGFFAEEVDLQAWDSIAAHSKGLNALTKVLQKGRYKTTTEQLTIPYRNGILHGMDLGYDNEMVAAKAWAALFAARDWAARAEQGLLTAPPEKPGATWGEIFQQVRENEEDKSRLRAWKPRAVRVGEDIPAVGEPAAFESGTPERTLVEFLACWKVRNYGYMSQRLSVKERSPINKAAARVRSSYASKDLKTFKLEAVNDEAPAITVIKAKLWVEEKGRITEREVDVRLLNENAEGNPVVRGKPKSDWSILTWHLA